ncbi:DMT family transporter [Variovorax boronicumulans]|uniref:DMT family transporter n=1 Tax=Variovorax boronicumulans TaxID=436515 RepID=UPI0012E5B85D|nr:DMT family transporter [Variovorax boronicumulans]GER14370.1 EamA/RhaT family transporter [Variovorax boronicumulans]
MNQPAPSHGATPASVQGWMLLAMLVWGVNVSAVKALTASFETLPLAALRMGVACIALSAIVLWRRGGVPRLTARQLAVMAGCAFLMVYGNQILFAQGLLRSTATNGALIMALSPLVSALMAALVFGERFTARRMVGVALGFAGVAAVVLSHPGAGLSSAGIGDLMLALSVVSFAVGGVGVQRLARQIDPLSISWVIYLIGTLMLVVHTVLGPSRLGTAQLFPGAWPWALVLFSGIAATAAGNLIWNRAISVIGVARTAVFLYWVPVFGVLFAALLLGEVLTWWHLFGFAAVMSGTWLGTRPVAAPAP